MAHRAAAVLSAFAVLVLAVPAGAVTPPCTQADLDGFDQYLDSHRCGTAGATGCLEAVVINGCSSGCPRQGYNYRVSPTLPSSQRQEIHMTLEYLRKLRNVAVKCRSEVLPRDSQGVSNSFDLTLESLLWSQVEMYLRHPQARYYDATFTPLPVSSVLSGNTVDPTRFSVVTWVNEGNTAHAMTQADFGLWLLTVAQEQAYWGQVSSMSHYLRLSERVFMAYSLRDEGGGVRNNRNAYRCYDNQYCYWFHSFPAGSYTWPSTVLNQDLHAIRDAMVAHAALASWRDSGYHGVALPAEFDNVHIDYLKDWARGGLAQLANSAGNQQQAGITAPPPNLGELLEPIQVVNGVQRYRAFYRYAFHPDELAADGLSVPAGRNITATNTCHYHFHSMAVMADILAMIRGSTSSAYFNADPAFTGAYFKLLYNRGAGDTQTCSTSGPASLNAMRGVPLAELFQGSLSGMAFHTACDDATDGYTDARDFNAQVGSRSDYETARAFYDSAYAGCTF